MRYKIMSWGTSAFNNRYLPEQLAHANGKKVPVTRSKPLLHGLEKLGVVDMYDYLGFGILDTTQEDGIYVDLHIGEGNLKYLEGLAPFDDHGNLHLSIFGIGVKNMECSTMKSIDLLYLSKEIPDESNSNV